jgi:hypothetical protein
VFDFVLTSGIFLFRIFCNGGSTVRKKPPSSISGARFPAWEPEYEAALREIDTQILFELIEAAEPAILTRRDALDGTGDPAERQAIEQALLKLQFLKKERLRFQ